VPRISYVERSDRFDAEVAAAAATDDSDRQLIILLGRPGLDASERIRVTAALGESGTGPEGSAAVHSQFSDAMARLTDPKSGWHWWRDLACAAVIALARREGPAATDAYLTAADSADRAVRQYGLMVLEVDGDDRAWDPMLARVGEILARKRISYGRWDELLMAVGYLARHSARNAARAERLITLLRANWGTLAHPPQKRVDRGPYVEPEVEAAARIEELWPGIEPDGPPAAALDLHRLHTPVAWWRPGSRPPSPGVAPSSPAPSSSPVRSAERFGGT
jgi:hypothetical protein